MSQVLPAAAARFTFEVPLVIVGAGACGLTAALAARDTGIDALLLERDASPSGSTSLSSGFVPAAATRFQRDAGIDDDSAQFAADILRKNKSRADRDLVERLAAAAGPALEWLADRHGLEWLVLDDFLYPGHSRHRMHAVPEKTGTALQQRLLTAARNIGADLLTDATVTVLYADEDGRVRGVRAVRPDGTAETIACRAVMLACNGYGGNPEMVAQYLPEMHDARYFGHAGNRGDAVRWGESLGAAVRHMTAYQGHGSVATPHGILITWALMMQGGIQVNTEGLRFSNEHQGYSEQAVKVLAQPQGVAWNIFDVALHQLGLGFEDYRTADAAGAIKSARDARELAGVTRLPLAALQETLAAVGHYRSGSEADPFGRDFTAAGDLVPPYYAVKVTGALFHTQGGLVTDAHARVLRADGTPLPNLFAGGGAACGLSGPAVWGYLSGNGLLTAIALGLAGGRYAARDVAAGGKPHVRAL